MTIELHIPGTPKGKARPRFVKATDRTYTPKDTEAAEARVREAWRLAGSIDLGDGPLIAVLTIAVARPASHLRVHGGLTAAGTRSWVPVRKSYLTRPQLAALMNVSVDTIDRLVKAGMPSVTWGRRTRRFRASTAIAWARAQDGRMASIPVRSIEPLTAPLPPCPHPVDDERVCFSPLGHHGPCRLSNHAGGIITE